MKSIDEENMMNSEHEYRAMTYERHNPIFIDRLTDSLTDWLTDLIAALRHTQRYFSYSRTAGIMVRENITLSRENLRPYAGC